MNIALSFEHIQQRFIQDVATGADWIELQAVLSHYIPIKSIKYLINLKTDILYMDMKDKCKLKIT